MPNSQPLRLRAATLDAGPRRPVAGCRARAPCGSRPGRRRRRRRRHLRSAGGPGGLRPRGRSLLLFLPLRTPPLLLPLLLLLRPAGPLAAAEVDKVGGAGGFGRRLGRDRVIGLERRVRKVWQKTRENQYDRLNPGRCSDSKRSARMGVRGSFFAVPVQPVLVGRGGARRAGGQQLVELRGRRLVILRGAARLPSGTRNASSAASDAFIVTDEDGHMAQFLKVGHTINLYGACVADNATTVPGRVRQAQWRAWQGCRLRGRTARAVLGGAAAQSVVELCCLLPPARGAEAARWPVAARNARSVPRLMQNAQGGMSGLRSGWRTRGVRPRRGRPPGGRTIRGG